VRDPWSLGAPPGTQWRVYAHGYLVFARVGFIFFDDRNLIFGIEPASQVHEFASFGAEGVKGARFVAIDGADGSLADGARGVGDGGVGGHG
jgi:hypothetical protein